MSYLRDLAQAIRAEVPAALVPQSSDDLFLIYAALARIKGESVTAQDVHEAWVAWMEMHSETHESMVPFSELPPSVRKEDGPFVAAIRAVARRSADTS
jgi:hypothetical protein